jgi:hypothetical protein
MSDNNPTTDRRLYQALNRIAYEPFGDAEASDKEVLAAVTELARVTLKHVAEPASEPIPMLLWCPSCGERHIDVGEFATKVHHTHACQHCGMVWRPAVVATFGVQWLPGFKNGR